MLKAIILRVGIFLPILYSCNEQKEKIGSGSFSIDTLSIHVPDKLLSQYYSFSVSVVKNNDHLMAYNNVNHQIDRFDLTNSEFIRSYAIQSDGPHKVKDVRTFAYQDSLFFIEGSQHVTILDESMKVKKRILINKVKEEFDPKMTGGYGVIDGKFLAPAFDVVNNSYFLPICNLIQRGRTGSYYDPFVLTISLGDTLADSIDKIKHPSSIRKNFYSTLEYPHFAFHSPYLLISFLYTPEVLMFNTITNTYKEHSFPGLSISRLAEPTSFNRHNDFPERNKYLNSSIKYYPLMYNAHTNLFARVIKDRTDPEEGYFAWADNYFSLYNQEKKHVAEWHLPSSFDPKFTQGKRDYYFQLIPEDESHLLFARVRPILPANRDN